MTKRVLLSLAVCCFFVLSPIRAVSAGEPAGAVRDAGADGLIDCGPGSEDTVWRIGDVTARVTCPASAAGVCAFIPAHAVSSGGMPAASRFTVWNLRLRQGRSGALSPLFSPAARLCRFSMS